MANTIKSAEVVAYLTAAFTVGIVVWFVSSNLAWAIVLPVGFFAMSFVGLAYRSRRKRS
jgi:hypothetical protein